MIYWAKCFGVVFLHSTSCCDPLYLLPYTPVLNYSFPGDSMPTLIGIWGNACTLSAEIMLKAEYNTISKKVGNWETVRYEFLIRLS